MLDLLEEIGMLGWKPADSFFVDNNWIGNLTALETKLDISLVVSMVQFMSDPAKELMGAISDARMHINSI